MPLAWEPWVLRPPPLSSCRELEEEGHGERLAGEAWDPLPGSSLRRGPSTSRLSTGWQRRVRRRTVGGLQGLSVRVREVQVYTLPSKPHLPAARCPLLAPLAATEKKEVVLTVRLEEGAGVGSEARSGGRQEQAEEEGPGGSIWRDSGAPPCSPGPS